MKLLNNSLTVKHPKATDTSYEMHICAKTCFTEGSWATNLPNGEYLLIVVKYYPGLGKTKQHYLIGGTEKEIHTYLRKLTLTKLLLHIEKTFANPFNFRIS